MDEERGKNDDGETNDDKMSSEEPREKGSIVNADENVEDDAKKKAKGGGLDLVFPPIPKSLWKPPSIVPVEQIGTGLNKMVLA